MKRRRGEETRGREGEGVKVGRDCKSKLNGEVKPATVTLIPLSGKAREMAGLLIDES